MDINFYVLKDILSERIQKWLTEVPDMHSALVEAADTDQNSFIHRLASEISDLYGED